MKTFLKISGSIFVVLLLVTTAVLNFTGHLRDAGDNGVHLASDGSQAYEVNGDEILIGGDGLQVGIENKYGLKPSSGLSESVTLNNQWCFDDQQVIGLAFASPKNGFHYATSSKAYEARLASIPNSKITSSLVTINGEQFSKFDQEIQLGCSWENCPKVYDTYYVDFIGDKTLEVNPRYRSCGAGKLGKEKIDEMINSVRIYR